MTDLAAWLASKRAASEGATEGPWTLLPAIDWFPHRVTLRLGLPSINIPVRNRSEEDAAEIAANARHIAAFDPATTRRLLDAAEVLAAFVEKVEAGKARSTDTYNRAKAALDALRGGGE